MNKLKDLITMLLSSVSKDVPRLMLNVLVLIAKHFVKAGGKGISLTAPLLKILRRILRAMSRKK